MRSFIARRPFTVLGAVLFAVTVFSLFSTLPSRFFHGLYVLLVNMQAYNAGLGLSGQRLEIGLILWGGMIKKALFESLPWAGFLVIPLCALVVKSPRSPIHILSFLMMGAYFAFFAPNQWHGGQSPNMRYFLPVLPFMSILGAATWHAIRQEGKPLLNSTVTRATYLIVLPLSMLILFLVFLIPTNAVSIAVASGVLRGLFLLSLVAALAWLALPRHRRLIRPLATVAFAYGLLAAAVTGYRHDLILMEERRAVAVEENNLNSIIPKKSLVVTPWPRFFQRILVDADGSVAIHLRNTSKFDYRLIDHALAMGQTVYVTYFAARDMRRDPAAEIYSLEPLSSATPEIYRLTKKIPAG